MGRQIFYFDTSSAVREHDKIIEKSGGSPGINNLGLLESPLEHIQNDWYYPEFHHKLTHLVFSINKSHVFTDGNKRSSIALGAYFLELNGYGYLVKKFVREMENIVVWVAEGKIEKDLLCDLIESLIYEDDYNESLKLSLAIAISDDWNQ